MSENSGLLLNAFRPSSKLSSKLLKNSKASCCSRKFTGSPQSLSKGENKTWLATHSVLNTSSSKTRRDRKESLLVILKSCQPRTTEQYFPVVLFIVLYNVVLTYESVDGILKREHLNVNYWAVISCGTVFGTVQGGSMWLCIKSLSVTIQMKTTE